ncbi:unnamed protein product [Ixodes persulcatus]
MAYKTNQNVQNLQPRLQTPTKYVCHSVAQASIDTADYISVTIRIFLRRNTQKKTE